MAIKSMIRLNQMVHEVADYDVAAIPVNGSNVPTLTAYSARSDMDEALKRITEILISRHGSGGITSGFLQDIQAGTIAHFADGDVETALVHQAGVAADDKIHLRSDAANAAAAILLQATDNAGVVKAQSPAEVIIDSPKLSLEDDGVILALGAADDVTLTHDSSAGLNMAGAGQFSLDFDTSVSVNSASGAINVGNDDIDQAINIGTDGERTISIGTDAGTGGPSTAVAVEAAAINIGTGGTAGAAITLGEATQANPIVLEAGTGSILADADGVIELNSSAAAISIGNDAVNQALNLGTGGVREIALGSAAASSLSMDGGVGAFTLQADSASSIDSGAALDISSTGIMSLDATDELHLNSSAGVIRIGNDAVDQNIVIGQQGAREIYVGAENETVMLEATASSAMFAAYGESVDPQNGNPAQLFADLTDLYAQSAAAMLEASHADGDLMMASGRDMAVLAASQQTAVDVTGATLAAAVQNLSAFSYASDASATLAADMAPDDHTLILGDKHARGTYNSGNSRFWSIDGIPLSLATKEWHDFKVQFGEVSLLNAMVQAGSGGTTDAGKYTFVIGSSGLTADNHLFSADSDDSDSDANRFSLQLFDSAGSAPQETLSAMEAFPVAGLDENEILSAVSVFVNGQLLLGALSEQTFSGSASPDVDYRISAFNNATSQFDAFTTVSYTHLRAHET